MKTGIRVLLALIALYTLGGVIDLLTVPETTADHHILAGQYLEERNLPAPPRAFRYDGCTMFPDRIPYHDLREVCLQHDIAYWAGGERSLQREINLEFRDAVIHTGPLGPYLAPVMYIAVEKLGDGLFSRYVSHSNWGFGWNE